MIFQLNRVEEMICHFLRIPKKTLRMKLSKSTFFAWTLFGNDILRAYSLFKTIIKLLIVFGKHDFKKIIIIK